MPTTTGVLASRGDDNRATRQRGRDDDQDRPFVRRDEYGAPPPLGIRRKHGHGWRERCLQEPDGHGLVPPRGMRVLVVDDYPGAADVSCILLRMLGHEALPATTGAEALSQAALFDPEVIVLDLGLPDQTGYDVARTLRERPGRRPFIAAMTGSTSDDPARSLAAGIDLHVTKPATVENLTRILDAARRQLGT